MTATSDTLDTASTTDSTAPAAVDESDGTEPSTSDEPRTTESTDSEGPDGSSSGAESRCGNGIVDDGELCDDGVNDGRYDGCSPGCGDWGPKCGDGIVQESAAEHCDYADPSSDLDCNERCQIRGSVIETIYQAVGVDGAPGQGWVTTWNGALTVVFGGGPQMVFWEIDTAETATIRVRASDEFSYTSLSGVAGLENGNLLLVGISSTAPQVVDTNLELQWTYEDPNAELWEEYTHQFVGVAPFAEGAMLGALRMSDSDPVRTAHWATGLASDGTTLWQAIEVHDADYTARDFRGLGEERGVLLLRADSDFLVPFSTFRIYDESGSVVADQPYTAVGGDGRQLCVGESGFFLFEPWVTEGRMTGFNSDGLPTFNVNYLSQIEVDVIGAGCAVRADNSPVLALSFWSSDEERHTLDLRGFEGQQATWTTLVETDFHPSWGLPIVHIEEDRSRAWIIDAGVVNLGLVAYLRATIVAI